MLLCGRLHATSFLKVFSPSRLHLYSRHIAWLKVVLSLKQAQSVRRAVAVRHLRILLTCVLGATS